MMKMKVVVLSCLMLMPVFVGAESDPPGYASPKCPSMQDLNSTTRYYLEKSFRRLIQQEKHEAKLASVGLAVPLALDDFRLLETYKDSAVCQKLNEAHGGIGAASFFVQDRELGGYKPPMFGMYYEVRDKYLVIWSVYNSGSDIRGEIGPPSPTWRSAIVYEKSNLNRIGDFGF